MMYYELRAETFVMELRLEIFKSDIELPVNSSLEIFIESDGFSANTTMDIDVKDFAKFAVDLQELYEKLKGKARIEEPYNVDNYIEFNGVGRGIINVSGRLNNHNRNGYEQELKFENEFDQTYLKTFANRVVQDVRL
ncbi:MAG: hypothetical protein PUE18_08335 [Firmicutes bacterium]|nr:hypothetical protein [Bacillota bacterium]